MPTPNILFLLADDLGWGDVGYHGSGIRTPNIDRLAASGVELDQHYVCPVCTPTRASLMTGRFPSRFGGHATVPSDQPVMADGYRTLAVMLRDAGYETGLFGKWHLGSDPSFYPGKYGFDTSYGSLAGGVDPYRHLYKRGPYSRTWHRNGELVDDVGHATDLIADEALAWIRDRAGPWFCYVPFTAVHTPIRAPEAWIDRYSGCVYDDDPARDRSFRVYAAYASHMDHAVGRFVELLKGLDQIDDTLLVFASDNGAPGGNPAADTALYPGSHEDTPRLGTNAPLRGHKGQLYEGGIRTPAAVQWPAVLSPGTVHAPIGIVDWMPTFAALTGCPTPAEAGWDGTDVMPLLLGERTARDQPLFWNLRHGQFAVRSGDWKIIAQEEGSGPTTELYNLAEDPFEDVDLASRHPGKVEELRSILEENRELDDSAKRTDVD